MKETKGTPPVFSEEEIRQFKQCASFVARFEQVLDRPSPEFPFLTLADTPEYASGAAETGYERQVLRISADLIRELELDFVGGDEVEVTVKVLKRAAS